MSNRAALYLRSSKDRSDISIDVQRAALHELAIARNLVIVAEFADVVLSGKDEDRPGFQQLVQALKQPARGWEQVLLLDTSRLARRRLISLLFEHDCEKRGVRVIYKSLPDDVDPATAMMLRSMVQAFDEYHSLISRAKGLAGMAENVRQGWRAGGRAPRGYKLDYHATGAIRDGAPVLKSKLVPTEDAAIVTTYLSSRAAGESRGSLIQRLKLDWPVVNLNPMEWQALTYAGHTVWNVHNERTADGYRSGEKRRPRAEWVITRDTHPALITDEEAEAILAQLERQKTVRTRTTDRPYLLTGFLVTPDGQPWHGEWDKRMDAALYRVGKGKKISARRVDQVVIDRMLEELQSDQAVDLIVASIRELVDEPVDGRRIAGLEKKLLGLTNKVGKLVDMLTEADGAVAEAYKRTINQAETERGTLLEELANLRTKANHHVAANSLGPDDVRRLLRLFADELRNGVDGGEVKTIKAALGGFIDRIVLDPVSESCTIHCRIATPDTGFIVASPRDTNANPVRWTTNVSILQRWAA